MNHNDKQYLHGLSIIDALDSEHLLGASIRDAESFKPWRACLPAIYGLALDSDAEALYRQCKL
jgi:hypothetical protein